VFVGDGLPWMEGLDTEAGLPLAGTWGEAGKQLMRILRHKLHSMDGEASKLVYPEPGSRGAPGGGGGGGGGGARFPGAIHWKRLYSGIRQRWAHK